MCYVAVMLAHGYSLNDIALGDPKFRIEVVCICGGWVVGNDLFLI